MRITPMVTRASATLNIGHGLKRPESEIDFNEIDDSPGRMKQTIEQVAERSGQDAGKGPVQKTIGFFQISVIDDENHRRDQIKKREYFTDRKTGDESARIDSEDRRPVVDE